jgi:DNA (cytosine-5)-methyltransferase 1
MVLEVNMGAKYKYKIRKLTPRETWRLMGFSDEDFEKAAAVNSQTQLYKQSGNSIVENVLMALFSQLNIQGVIPWNEVN